MCVCIFGAKLLSLKKAQFVWKKDVCRPEMEVRVCVCVCVCASIDGRSRPNSCMSVQFIFALYSCSLLCGSASG